MPVERPEKSPGRDLKEKCGPGYFRSRSQVAWSGSFELEVTVNARGSRGLHGMVIFFLCLSMAIPGVLKAAQEDTDASTHWAFSAFFGTGWYQIPDNRSVYIFRIPPRQVVRQSFFDGSAETRKVGIEIHYPLTLGLVDIKDIGGIISPDNFGTVSFTPGIELEIPVTQKWYLRPLAHAGWGRETNGGNSAWIYYAGIKSRYTPGNGGIQWSLLNAFNFAGYKPERGASDSLASFMVGAELRQPISWMASSGDQLNLDWHFTYTRLVDKADFTLPRQISKSVNDEWEFGLALQRQGRPIRIWFVDFEHVGLSFRWSPDSDFRAITVNLRSPFSR